MYVLLPNEPNERWFEYTHTVSRGAAAGRWGHWHRERSWPLACSLPPVWGLKLWALTSLPPWWPVRCGLSWQGGQEPHRGLGCSSDFQEPHCPQEQNKKRSSARRIEFKKVIAFMQVMTKSVMQSSVPLSAVWGPHPGADPVNSPSASSRAGNSGARSPLGQKPQRSGLSAFWYKNLLESSHLERDVW